ncbi:MAG: hypothetical protein ACPGJO_15120, partial [bacterium]
VVASATVGEEFPSKFGIYDLNEFIGVLGLMDTPSLKFDDEFVTGFPGQVVGHLTFIIFFRIIGDHEKNDRGNQERIKVTFKNIH